MRLHRSQPRRPYYCFSFVAGLLKYTVACFVCESLNCESLVAHAGRQLLLRPCSRLGTTMSCCEWQVSRKNQKGLVLRENAVTLDNRDFLSARSIRVYKFFGCSTASAAR